MKFDNKFRKIIPVRRTRIQVFMSGTIGDAIESSHKQRIDNAKYNADVQRLNDNIDLWRAVCVADAGGMIGQFALALSEFMRTSKIYNLEVIELLLRAHGCKAWVIALNNPVQGLKFVTAGGKKATYYAHYTLATPEANAAYLLHHANSYEDNFGKLGETGFLTVE